MSQKSEKHIALERNAATTKCTKWHNTRQVRLLILHKENVVTITNKWVSEDKQSLCSTKKLRLQERLYWGSNVRNVRPGSNSLWISDPHKITFSTCIHSSQRNIWISSNRRIWSREANVRKKANGYHQRCHTHRQGCLPVASFRWEELQFIRRNQTEKKCQYRKPQQGAL